MIVRIHPESFVDASMLAEAHDFLVSRNLVSEVVRWEWTSAPDCPKPRVGFPLEDATEADADLSLGFLNKNKAHNRKLIHRLSAPMFLVGAEGLPRQLDRVTIPFEGKQFHAVWLRRLAERARDLQWPVRLLHCDHGVVAHEIMKLASWFHLDAVREAMKQWITDDLEQAFQQFIQDFPDTEIKADVGHLGKALQDGNPVQTLIMGSLAPGYHLRHHGLNYHALLTRTGFSAYLLSD